MVSKFYELDMSEDDELVTTQICPMPVNIPGHLWKSPCDPGGRGMGNWAYYAGFHWSDFGLKHVQGVVPCGGSAIAPLKLCEVESLPAESLSGFLCTLRRPAPARRHMDPLNGLSAESLTTDDESKEKQSIE